ncbi:MAG: 1-acyl-sn-glycerol-3-phosphate acyltransferase [Actinomycetia bacterium]|nr:1-acyl-sn-glycerol-3-phosphate acyltransferase [Actinomycetes bacterium]
MKAGQRIVVTDVATADFGEAGRGFPERVIDEGYPYQRRNPAWHGVSAFLYYVLLPPVALVLALAHGVRLRGRDIVREAGGCYLYGNHTNWFDVFIPFLLAFPRRAYIVTGPTAVSVPFVRHLVPMLGGIPLNTTPAGKRKFRAALDVAVRRGCPVAVFPEAHEWPFYNGIRDFPAYSFTYPVGADAPVVPYAVTYRRRFSRRLKPHMSIIVGPAIRPSAWQGLPDPKQALRDRVHEFMCRTVRGSFAWVEYVLPGTAPQPTSGPV